MFFEKTEGRRKFSVKNNVDLEPPYEGMPEAELSEGSDFLDQMEQVEFLPYHNDGQVIILFDRNNRMIDKADVSHLSRVCGDGCAEALLTLR